MGSFNLKEGFISLKHKIEKNPVKAIAGVLAGVLLSSCATIIANDLANRNPVAAAPQPTPRVTFVNTPIPTGVPTLEPTIVRPTEVPPTLVPTRPAVAAIVATQPISGSIGGSEGVSSIKDAVIPGDIADKIASVNSAVLRAGLGYGGINEKAEALTVNDTKATEGMKPFVLKIKATGAQYFVITPNGEIAQGRFFNITSLGKPETIISPNDLKPYEIFLKNINPELNPTKVVTEGNNVKENPNKVFAIDVVNQSIKESKRPIISVRSGYSISGTKFSLDFWSLNEGTTPLYSRIDPKYSDPVKNAIGFKALATLVPSKANINEVIAYRGLFENSSSIAQTIKQKLLDKGWTDVSINQKPEYFKLQSQVDLNGNSILLVWDSRGLGGNLSYYQENPFGALYNTADNPVSLNKMTLSDVITLLGGGLEGEEAQKLVALFLKP